MTGKIVKPRSETEMRIASLAIRSLIDQLSPLLNGQEPDIVGAALADLMGTLLAGHFDKGGWRQTKKLRAYLLARWVETVEELIPIKEKTILKSHKVKMDGTS